MKRKQPGEPNTKIHTVGATRLTAVRGGTGLGIIVAHGNLAADYMQGQHNEALIRL